LLKNVPCDQPVSRIMTPQSRLITVREGASLEEAKVLMHKHRLERLEDEVAPQTLNRDRTALLGMLNRAVEWKLLDGNPLNARLRRLTSTTTKRVRWLGQHDENEDIRDDQGQGRGACQFGDRVGMR
jgi:CBS domain-containing protein